MPHERRLDYGLNWCRVDHAISAHSAVNLIRTVVMFAYWTGVRRQRIDFDARSGLFEQAHRFFQSGDMFSGRDRSIVTLFDSGIVGGRLY